MTGPLIPACKKGPSCHKKFELNEGCNYVIIDYHISRSSACSGDSVKQKIYPKVALDIPDAEYLVAMGILQADIAATQTNFYKILSDGSFEPVKYISADGAAVDTAAYQNLTVDVRENHNLTDEYVFLEGPLQCLTL